MNQLEWIYLSSVLLPFHLLLCLPIFQLDYSGCTYLVHRTHCLMEWSSLTPSTMDPEVSILALWSFFRYNTHLMQETTHVSLRKAVCSHLPSPYQHVRDDHFIIFVFIVLLCLFSTHFSSSSDNCQWWRDVTSTRGEPYTHLQCHNRCLNIQVEEKWNYYWWWKWEGTIFCHPPPVWCWELLVWDWICFYNIHGSWA